MCGRDRSDHNIFITIRLHYQQFDIRDIGNQQSTDTISDLHNEHV